MPLKEDLKALIIKSGWTMTQVVEALNQKYGRNTSVQNFSSKLIRGTFKYTEVEEILEIIGYKIDWTESEKKSVFRFKKLNAEDDAKKDTP